MSGDYSPGERLPQLPLGDNCVNLIQSTEVMKKDGAENCGESWGYHLGGLVPIVGHLWYLTHESCLPEGNIKYKKERTMTLFKLSYWSSWPTYYFWKSSYANERAAFHTVSRTDRQGRWYHSYTKVAFSLYCLQHRTSVWESPASIPPCVSPWLKSFLLLREKKEQVWKWHLSQITLRATTQVSTSELVV